MYTLKNKANPTAAIAMAFWIVSKDYALKWSLLVVAGVALAAREYVVLLRDLAPSCLFVRSAKSTYLNHESMDATKFWDPNLFFEAIEDHERSNAFCCVWYLGIVNVTAHIYIYLTLTTPRSRPSLFECSWSKLSFTDKKPKNFLPKFLLLKSFLLQNLSFKKLPLKISL
jgi:hypothetical protein